MARRRTFIAGGLGAGLLLGLRRLFPGWWRARAAGPAGSGGRQRPNPGREGTRREYMWQRTIFCQVGDPELLAEVGQVARKLNCEIWHGKPGTPDIIAVPSFFVIVDRNTMTRSLWDDYLEYRRQTDDRTPCLVVDGLDWPGGARVEAYHPLDRRQLRRLAVKLQIAWRRAGRSRPGGEDVPA